METETYILNVFTLVHNQPRNIEATNTVSIYLQQLIQDETGTVRVSGPEHIRLNPRGDFTPHHLSRLLREQVPEFQSLGETIAHHIDRKLASDQSLQEPLLVTVAVDFVKERRLILPPPPPPVLPTPSRGASREVLQRLAKEQRVESKDLEGKNEIQCSICIEDWSKSHTNVIEMPQCKHMFHQGCLFEWLRRQNSCPLCRRVPYQ